MLSVGISFVVKVIKLCKFASGSDLDSSLLRASYWWVIVIRGSHSIIIIHTSQG